MTGKTNILTHVMNDQSSSISLKIWSRTGDVFQEHFPLHQTKFSHVKYLAMKSLFQENYFDEMDNYKLISIDSKRVIDESKTLSEERVKNGDEFLLATKTLNPSSRVIEVEDSISIDEALIQQRTRDLRATSEHIPRAQNFRRRAEFRTDLNRILLTLIETAHKLLWFRSDAEQIFRQVEKMLSKSVNESDESPIDANHVHKLTDLGFTEKQAQIALRRTKSDFHAAMELLLSQPDIAEEENQITVTPITIYSHNSTFIPFRQFRQKYFQPNPTAVRSLEDMGFNRETVIDALQICHNNQTLACDYLIGDEQQQQTIREANSQEGLDPDSNLFKAVMENPYIQRAVNNPKLFFIMLQLYEDPDIVTTCINEPELGNMILQISRIYNTERYQMDVLHSNRRDNDHHERLSSSTTENDDE